MIILRRGKHKNLDNSSKLILIRFILSFGIAAAGIVWSLYMHSLGFSESSIGFIAAGVALFSLIFTLKSTVILEFFGEKRIFLLSMILYIVSYSIISFSESKILFIVVSFIVMIATVLGVNSFGILFRDSVSKKNMEEKEGLLFTFTNFGWLIAPIIAGIILANLGFSYVFLLSSIAFILATIMFSIIYKDNNVKKFKTIDRDEIKNIKEYFSKKELIYPYIVLFGMRFIESFLYIFLPIFMFKRGMLEEYIGILFGVMALVHTVFDFEMGKIAPKFGYKRLFTIGFILSGLLFFVASFFNDNIYMIFGLMIVLSFITLLIEPLHESFLFLSIKKKKDEEKFYPIFCTAIETGNLFGKILIASILLFLPNSFAYIGISIVLLTIGIIISRMKK